jgi:hypothetical protein
VARNDVLPIGARAAKYFKLSEVSEFPGGQNIDTLALHDGEGIERDGESG